MGTVQFSQMDVIRAGGMGVNAGAEAPESGSTEWWTRDLVRALAKNADLVEQRAAFAQENAVLERELKSARGTRKTLLILLAVALVWIAADVIRWAEGVAQARAAQLREGSEPTWAPQLWNQ